MNNEFKKITQDNVTRYVLESDGGTTSSGSIASNDSAGFKKGLLLTREGNKKTEPPKTRNPVAKNASAAIGGGAAGAHKDKKKAAKQGQEKHKKPYMENFNGEYDDEAGMAKGSLETMSRAVNGLMDTIQDGDNLPEWAQEKLSIAEDYLTTVWDYLLSQKEQGIDPGIGEGKEDKISQLKKDHETAVHWSKNDTNPHKREAARRKAETIKAHLEKQYKQVVEEGDAGLSKDAETNFHAKLDQLVHATFGKRKEEQDTDEDMSRRGFLKGAGAMAAGISASGGAHADEKSDPNKLMASMLMGGEYKEFDLTPMIEKNNWVGTPKQVINQADKWLSDFLRQRGNMYSNLKIKYKGLTMTSSKIGDVDASDSEFESVEEGAKVDRQAKHITASMMKKGKSKKDAESIAWAHIKHPKNESADSYFESLSNSLAEKLDPNAPVDDWVQDFAQANPEKYHQFRQNNRPGTRKSEKKIERMAQAASYAAKTGK